MKVRSEKTKQEFIEMMNDHPEWRFWQTVRNFVMDRYNFVIVSNVMPQEGQRDTFHWEENE